MPRERQVRPVCPSLPRHCHLAGAIVLRRRARKHGQILCGERGQRDVHVEEFFWAVKSLPPLPAAMSRRLAPLRRHIFDFASSNAVAPLTIFSVAEERSLDEHELEVCSCRIAKMQ